MELTAYKKIITMAKEKISEALAPIRAMQVKKQGEIELAKLDEKIITQQVRIEEIASEYPVDFNKLINALDDLALSERRHKQFETIISQMFPEKE